MNRNARPWEIEGQKLSYKISTDLPDGRRAKRILASFIRTIRALSANTVSGLLQTVDTGAWYAVVASSNGTRSSKLKPFVQRSFLPFTSLTSTRSVSLLAAKHETPS